MTTSAIVPILADPGAEHSPVDAARVLSGNPVTTVANGYSSPDGRFHAGVWTSTPGAWRVQYTEHEYCMLTEGLIRLVSDDGTSVEYQAPAAFVIPAGFIGRWETITRCSKHYVIYEPV